MNDQVREQQKTGGADDQFGAHRGREDPAKRHQHLILPHGV
jgi:hypothetical protein